MLLVGKGLWAEGVKLNTYEPKVIGEAQYMAGGDEVQLVIRAWQTVVLKGPLQRGEGPDTWVEVPGCAELQKYIFPKREFSAEMVLADINFEGEAIATVHPSSRPPNGCVLPDL